MPSFINKKNITGWLSLALLIFGSVSAVSYRSMNVLGTSLSFGLLLWIYYFLYRQNAKRQQAEEKLELFFSQCRDGFFFMMLDEPVRWDRTADKEKVLDYVFAHQHITKANDALLKQYGATPEELLGRSPADFFAGDLVYGRAAWQQLFDTGRLHIETQERQCDGTPIWIEGNYICLYDAQGKITGHVGIQRDITERKRAEQERERFFNLSLDMLAIGSFEGYFTHLNPAWERTLGFTLEELKARPFLEFVHPADWEATQAAIKNLKAGIPLTTLENRYRCKDGSYKWLSWSAVAFLEEGLIYGVARDVSDCKQAQEALRQSEARFQRLVANVPGIIYRYLIRADGSDAFTYVSPGSCELYELEPETIQQNADTLWALVHPDNLKSMQDSIATSVQTLQSWHWEGRIITPSGRLKWIQGASRPEKQANGDILWDGLLMDITERKQAEEALQQQMQREQLLGAMTWQIRQSLDLDQILGTTVTEVRQLLNADRVLIFRLCPDGLGRIVKEAVVPAWPVTLEMIFPDEYFASECYDFYCQGQPRIVPNVAKDDWASCLVEFMQQVGVKSKVVVPIVQRVEVQEQESPIQNRLWGLLIAHACSEYRQWQQGEVDLLQQLGNQVAIAIQQADLYSRVQLELSRSQEAEDALLKIRDELEIRVQERTAELARINESLQSEISDRKLAEEALRVSEERFRIALKNSPTVVFNQDTEFRYTWIYNPTLELAVDEVVGKLESEIFSPEDAQRMLEIKGRVLATGVGTREETFVTFNGEVRYWDLTLEPLHNLDGEIIGITCASTDITDLRVREIQLRAIFESAHEAIVIADDEARYVEANPAASRIFGLPLLELLNRRIADFIEPGLDFELAWRTFQGKEHSTGEVRLLRPDGTVREVEYTSKANFLPGLHLSVLRDVTVRKQAENALRESQRFIQQIADTTPNLIYIYDLSQDCNVYANRQCWEFFCGTQPEIQAMGSPLIPELLHPKDRERVVKVLNQLATAQDGEVIEDEFRLKNAKGEWRWFHSWEVVFTRNTEGKPEQILGTAIDITEQKETEEIRACLEAEKELRKLQLSFFSMASHEFRTPLSVILVTAQLLQSYAEEWSEEKIRRNLQRIEAAAKNMTQLLDDILTINRAESGKLELNLQSISLGKFCRHLLEEMQLNASSKHKIIFVNQSQCLKVNVDEKLLRSILNNLLSNAIKYSPQGGDIHLVLTCEKGQAALTIQDPGLGIPLEDQKHVFEPFHRGKNIGNIPGTGLGLTVIKKYLELQGGKISLKSEVGVGTTVTVTLPCKTC